MSVQSLKSPWHREAEFMHAVVTGILSSTASGTAQATHSSSPCWLHACSWHLIFSLQLLSLPELLPQSHPAPHPSALAVLSRGGGQILPQQQGGKAQIPAAAAQEQESLHVEESQTRLVLSRAWNILPDTQTFSSLQNLLLGTILLPFAPFWSIPLLEGWNSSRTFNLCCFSLSRWSASQSSVMAERWWHHTGLHLKKSLCTSKPKSSNTDNTPSCTLASCCIPVPFSWSVLPTLMCCRLRFCKSWRTQLQGWLLALQAETTPQSPPFPHSGAQPRSWDHKWRLPPKTLCHKMLGVCSYLVLHPTGESEGCVPFPQSQRSSEDIGAHQG